MDSSFYWRALRRWRWFILLFSVTCAVTAGLVSLQLPKTYEVKAVALVSPKQLIPPASSTDQGYVPSLDQLVETYSGLINSTPVREGLARRGVPRDAGQLLSEISALRQPNTTLITITAHDGDPAVALLIAQNIIPAFNDSLDQLQSKVASGTPQSHLESLVPWEVPTAAPGSPISPVIPRNVLIALGAGLLVAVGVAFLLERLDNSIKSEQDVRLRLGMPVLGNVYLRPKSSPEETEPLGMVSATHRGDAISEQYRSLRTNVMFTRLGEERRNIVITSSIPGEGKTTTACNLAVVLAQAGHSVILVDADFRRPEIHNVFNYPRNLGLGNLILGNVPEADLILPTSVPNLRIVCSGPTPPNPSELLGTSSMDRIISRLNTMSDLVIFDTPPVGAVTDATVLSTLCDGVVLVVEQGRTRIPVIQRTCETLQGVGADVLGIVLNKAKSSKNDYYYEYYYGKGDRTAPSGAPSNQPAEARRPS